MVEDAALLSKLLSKVAEHGLLALLLCIALWAVYKLFQKYEGAQERRIEEAKSYDEKFSAAWKIVEGLMKERAELIDALHTVRRALEHRMRE